MKKLLILISVFAVACSSSAPGTSEDHVEGKQENHEHEKKDSPETLALNQGVKWKADETTKKNVDSLINMIKRTVPANEAGGSGLAKELQSRVNILVKECQMKGRDHDALHLWLNQVSDDIRKLKENEDVTKSYTTLKKDVEDFYIFFE